MRLFLIFITFLISQPAKINVKLKDQGIPSVNKGLYLEAVIKGKRELLPVKFMINKDDVSFEVKANLAGEDLEGNLIYSAIVPAPIYELKAVAYSILPDGSTIRSPKFSLTRPCIEKESLEKIPDLKNLKTADLLLISEGLAQDINIYQQLMKQIETLKSLYLK